MLVLEVHGKLSNDYEKLIGTGNEDSRKTKTQELAAQYRSQTCAVFESAITALQGEEEIDEEAHE